MKADFKDGGSAGARSPHRYWFGWIAGLSALAVGAIATTLFAGTEREAQRPTPARSAARSVRVDSVTVGRVERPWRFYGVTRSTKRATLSFTVGGRLQARPAIVGTRVKRGQVLARLDQRRFVHEKQSSLAALSELETRLLQKRRDRDRARARFEEEAVSLSELERERSSADALEALQRATKVRVSEATRVVGEGVLRAGFDGEIIEVFVEPGEYVQPGAPVVALSGSGELETLVEVPEAAITRVREGLPTTVRLPLVDARVTGHVESIGDAAPERGGLFPVLIRLDSAPGVRAGMTAEVAMVTEGDVAMSVPVAAIVDPSGQHPHVFVVEQAKVVKVPVHLGTVDGKRVTVTGRLAAGSQVVVAGHQYLLDGDAVAVRS